MNLSLVIPCFNESGSLAQMHEQLSRIRSELERRGTFELVLVDDCSADDTYMQLPLVFADFPHVTVLHHEQNRGPGAALRTGFSHARGEIIVTTDCDGTYAFTTIPTLLDHLTPNVEIVTASPYHPQGSVEGVPAYRLLFSKGASILYRLLVDPHLHTYTAMYRAYRREVIESITTTSDGFLMFTELLVEAMLAGYRVAEYPTILRVRRFGQSKARIARITRSHLRYQFQVMIRRIQMLVRHAERV